MRSLIRREARDQPEDAAGAPVWSSSWSAPDADGNAGGPPVRASRRPDGFLVAFGLYSVLQFGAAVLRHTDDLVRSPGTREAVVGYGLCCALVATSVVLRGRWRSLLLVPTALFAAALPVWLSRGLLQSMPPRDVWIGQSLTPEVAFPLATGLTAAYVALRRGRRESTPPHEVVVDPDA